MTKRSGSTSSNRRGQTNNRRGKQQTQPTIKLSLDQQLDILGYVLLVLALFTILSFLSTQQGRITGFWLSSLGHVFGWGLYVVPLFMGVGGLWLVLRRFGDRLPKLSIAQVLGVLLLFLATLTTLHFPASSDFGGDVWAAAQAGQGGGAIGALFASSLFDLLGGAATIVVLLIWWLAAIMITFRISLADLSALFNALIGLAAGGSHQRQRDSAVPWRRPTDSADSGDVPAIFTPSGERLSAAPAASRPPSTAQRSPVTAEPAAPVPVRAAREAPPSHTPAPVPSPTPSSAPGQLQPIGSGQTWLLPRLSDIMEPGTDQDFSEDIIRQHARIIEETLISLGAPGKVKEINRGPAVTQFGVEPLFTEGRGGRQTKVKVSKIASLVDDLALALSAKSVRIEAPVPGKGLVGIEVPNTEIALVALRDVMESEAYERLDGSLRLGLGQDVSGRAVVADLADMPHLLIAGTTGSGKSVCVNSIIAALLMQNTPDQLRLLMVDPKRVELTQYNGIPHLVAPVVVDIEKVVNALQWVLNEMDGRYRRFAKAGARNLEDFNARVAGQDEEKPMPYIVVFIDELADMMMLSPEQTERSICRLAQMARATGIHLVIATQRPSVDVVTGLIKANFPARIAFAVASSVDSRVILDMPGAERLLGRGDMLFMSPDASQPVRLQGAYVSEDELSRLVRFWRGGRQLDPVSAPAMPVPVQRPLWENLDPQPAGPAGDEYEDPLLPDAIQVLLAEGRASISLLQRRMRIGYTRSARLVDLLEQAGVIGPVQAGSQTREVNFVKAQHFLRSGGKLD